MTTIAEVLTYWFPPPLETEDQVMKRVGFWFMGGPEADREIRERFAGAVAEAEAGKLDGWAETPPGRLALVILLDQFTRNIHRGAPEAFASDGKTQALVAEGMARGHYDALTSVTQKLFFLLPFEHAEDLPLQRRSVAMAERLYVDAPPAMKKFALVCVDHARKHFDVVARFGRFPHRNATLRREPTPDERDYLDFLRASGQQL